VIWGCYISVAEDGSFLGYDTMSIGPYLPLFLRSLRPPSSGFK